MSSAEAPEPQVDDSKIDLRRMVRTALGVESLPDEIERNLLYAMRVRLERDVGHSLVESLTDEQLAELDELIDAIGDLEHVDDDDEGAQRVKDWVRETVPDLSTRSRDVLSSLIAELQERWELWDKLGSSS